MLRVLGEGPSLVWLLPRPFKCRRSGCPSALESLKMLASLRPS